MPQSHEGFTKNALCYLEPLCPCLPAGRFVAKDQIESSPTIGITQDIPVIPDKPKNISK